MRFISGLKNLSKKRLLLIIVILFSISWLLFTIMFVIYSNVTFSRYFLWFIGILAGFTFIIFIISFAAPIEKMGIIVILIAAVLTLPIIWIFTGIIKYFFYFSFFANTAITAFFAYKFCMDTSTKVDDYLYKNKKTRIITRVIEFVVFFLLNWWFTSIVVRFFGFGSIARVFFNLFLIGIILLGITLIRLIFIKKLAAYISFFNLLTFFYVIYLVINLLAEFIFYDPSGYDIFSFCIDFFLFIYIIGSIYDRVDYIKEKVKIFRVDTIALFVILMKLIVQIINIIQELYLPIIPAVILQQIINQVQVLWIFFAIITIFVGIYTIFKHKEGE
ncbi:MAG: hypothetical protein ACFFDH_20460 [Promethearchaeota archaeon]